jgi:hypothetical protein
VTSTCRSSIVLQQLGVPDGMNSSHCSSMPSRHDEHVLWVTQCKFWLHLPLIIPPSCLPLLYNLYTLFSKKHSLSKYTFPTTREKLVNSNENAPPNHLAHPRPHHLVTSHTPDPPLLHTRHLRRQSSCHTLGPRSPNANKFSAK